MVVRFLTMVGEGKQEPWNLTKLLKLEHYEAVLKLLCKVLLLGFHIKNDLRAFTIVERGKKIPWALKNIFNLKHHE